MKGKNTQEKDIKVMKANQKDRKLQEFIQESRVVAENSISTDEMKEYINDLCDELEKCTNLRKFLKDANRGAERNYKLAMSSIEWVNDVRRNATAFFVSTSYTASNLRLKVAPLKPEWQGDESP